uniref:Uncharacterized protein n=1 Tax=Anguilla anguilla TaxID=7936 RepID=A0A0E9V8D7_ANGAN
MYFPRCLAKVGYNACLSLHFSPPNLRALNPHI